MKNKVSALLVGATLVLSVFLTGCDQKSPEKGFVSDEVLQAEVIDKIDSSIVVEKVSYTGTLNYFDYEEILVPRSVSKSNQDFIDSKDQYSADCTSYYLSLPLHITSSNWVNVKNQAGVVDADLSTKYRLESRIYQPNSGYNDRVYYYLREGGGFYLKAFGVNKALRINQPSGITCHAKWNIVIEYDENGFLISESFATLNAHKEADSKSCYGQATYSYR